MRTENKRGVILAGVVVGLVLAIKVMAAVWISGTFTLPTYIQSVTNGIAWTNSAASIPVIPGTDLAVWSLLSGNSTNASAVVVGYDVTGDLTNWSTTTPLTTTNNLNKGSNVFTWNVFTAAQLKSVQAIRPASLGNVGGATAVSNTASGYSYFY